MFSHDSYKLSHKLTVVGISFVLSLFHTKPNALKLSISQYFIKPTPSSLIEWTGYSLKRIKNSIWLIFYTISIIIPNHLFCMDNESLFWNHNLKDKFLRSAQKQHPSFKFNRFGEKEGENAWIFMPKSNWNWFVNQFVTK